MRPAVTPDGSFSKGRALRFLMRMHSGRLWSNMYFKPFGIVYLIANVFIYSQLILFWSFLFFNQTAAAIFGAPLVGYLTSGMIDETTEKGVAAPEKANALAYNIFVLSTLFWILCCCFWCLMAYYVDSNAASGVRSGKGGVEYAELGQREDAASKSKETIASSEAMGRGIELLQVA